MIANIQHSPQRVRDRLAGQHILLTGATGFLAKAFIEKVLRSVDSIGGLHLLVRPRADGTSADQRVLREVLKSSAFDRLRASLGDRFSRLCEEKISVVSGDLTKSGLAIAAAEYADLTRRITLVVNSAATVTFDERLDLAVELNALGPQRLLQFAKDAGNLPLMHVSTCYVCGARKGTIVEDLSAPEPARELLPRLPDGSFDLDRLVACLRADVQAICAKFGAETETCRRKLIDCGMSWSRKYGWNDTYTFTKWIGEQLLVRDRGETPLVIFRPAIIEGSFDEPTPGWIDGLRMADPIIVAFGRGKIDSFPALPDAPIDLIPVDFVANAMIATLPAGEARPRGVAVCQCASSDRNPLKVRGIASLLGVAFDRRPMNGDDGRPVRPGEMKLVDRDKFIRRWEAKRRRVERAHRLLTMLGRTGRRVRRLAGMIRQIDQIIYFARIYSPYTNLDCTFSDDYLKRASEQLHPEDRSTFQFDPKHIDWEDYIVNRHVPGLRSFVLGTSTEPPPRILGVNDWQRLSAEPIPRLERGQNLFAMFERAAKRFPDKPALQVCRNTRWIRYTYDEAYRATGTIMKRFVELGLRPGDRVAICSENGPEWGLAYLAVMRAGLTAVPLDPQLPPAEVWGCARFAQARLLCAGRSTVSGLQARKDPGDCELIPLIPTLVPPPGASRDAAPAPVAVDERSVASILFTSGTTVAPKAVQLTHGNLIANATALFEAHPVNPTDEFLSVLPLYHAFEFTGGFFVPVVCGATITYLDQLKSNEILSALQATGTTVMLVVPRMLRMFLDSIENKLASAAPLRRMVFRSFGLLSDLTGGRFARRLFNSVHQGFGGRLRMLVCGGSRLDPELFNAYRRLGFTIYEGYGLTETSPVLTVHRAGDGRPGSVGPPLPNVELEVRNPNLEGVGEVWVKGPSVMSGYLDNREATEEVLVEGWLRTGDLGKCKEDGHLYLTGRSKDLIITGAGKNVYPDEVEIRYKDLPYTKEYCVFGLPADDGLGDVIHVVIVPDEAAAPGLDRSSIEREVREAAAAIGEGLPMHQRIAVLHFWDKELPKTSTLKAKRGQIREMILRERLGPAAVGGPADRFYSQSDADEEVKNPAAFQAVRQILCRQSTLPEGQIRPKSHLLLDLGIDSIGRIDVLGSIEARFNLKIDDAAAAKIARVSDILRLVGARTPSSGGTFRPDAWRRFVGANGPGASVNGNVPPVAAPVRWLARGSVGALMHSYVRVHVVGRENIPDKGPFILAPNHCSHLDAPAVLTAVGAKRRVWIAGAEDYFFNNRLKRFVFGKLFDTIPFDRQADGVAGLRRCGEALARGDGILIFPEGTRSPSGRLQDFKVGVAVLATQRNAPVVPVYIRGAFDLFKKGARFVRPGSITVAFGPPIPAPEPCDDEDRYAAFLELTSRLHSAVKTLADKAATHA